MRCLAAASVTVTAIDCRLLSPPKWTAIYGIKTVGHHCTQYISVLCGHSPAFSCTTGSNDSKLNGIMCIMAKIDCEREGMGRPGLFNFISNYVLASATVISASLQPLCVVSTCGMRNPHCFSIYAYEYVSVDAITWTHFYIGRSWWRIAHANVALVGHYSIHPHWHTRTKT